VRNNKQKQKEKKKKEKLRDVDEADDDKCSLFNYSAVVSVEKEKRE
jgi:hypothetical protein